MSVISLSAMDFFPSTFVRWNVREHISFIPNFPELTGSLLSFSHPKCLLDTFEEPEDSSSKGEVIPTE